MYDPHCHSSDCHPSLTYHCSRHFTRPGPHQRGCAQLTDSRQHFRLQCDRYGLRCAHLPPILGLPRRNRLPLDSWRDAPVVLSNATFDTPVPKSSYAYMNCNSTNLRRPCVPTCPTGPVACCKNPIAAVTTDNPFGIQGPKCTRTPRHFDRFPTLASVTISA